MSVKLLLLALVISSLAGFAQVKGTIIDSETKQPIPWVNIWVEGKNSGASANVNGEFILPVAGATDNLVVSAVGYGTAILVVSRIKDTIWLAPQPIVLDEVVVNPHKPGKKKLVLNPFETVEQEQYNGKTGTGPFMLARFIPYNSSYSETPYLGKIRFRVRKPHKDMFFNLRLCAVNSDGSPGDFLYDENILVTFKKKKEYAETDFSKLNITMPKEGFFVVVEFVITEQNIASALMEGGIITDHLYGPEFVHQQMPEAAEGWMYDGKWIQKSVFWKEKYGVLAAEVTLTD